MLGCPFPVKQWQSQLHYQADSESVTDSKEVQIIKGLGAQRREREDGFTVKGFVEEMSVRWVLKYEQDFDGLGRNVRTWVGMCRENWNCSGSWDWLERRLRMGTEGRKDWGGWQRSPWLPVIALVPPLCAERFGEEKGHVAMACLSSKEPEIKRSPTTSSPQRNIPSFIQLPFLYWLGSFSLALQKVQRHLTAGDNGMVRAFLA